ncbi:tripartite tricarboxylate transporter substrate binding protein [Ramlibacter sp. G-1-2-2]|uniref:Tripartite tricarboxylate transporter substrate binding protein n=1 Tax=Ramlibacter agri TaxID=2728837 RepID=A0A848GZE2_9BURK|nr:tripartite tricarboxylate transporter substrate binding protein [Ramlibacter agri]NML42170.1 tripartite tricarboxylate transporter substrate binding protein [Ramlibacter agri]
MQTWKLLGACALAAVLAPAQAAGYPERPVRLVIPFPPGAAADNALRVVTQKMSESLGQPVIIENKPGIPGVQAAAMAAPDGYTFLLGAGSNMVTGPLLNTHLAYNPARDFTPVGRVLFNVPVLTAHPSLGVKTVPELVALARRQPGRLNFSSSGTGSPNHLSMEMFELLTKTEMVHVPYKGAAPSVNELLAGVVQLGINAVPSVAQHIQAGKLVPLAVASAKRSPLLPNVPTFAEAGLPEFTYDIWYAVFAPARTPADAVNKVSAALQGALNDPAVAGKLRAQGAEPAPSTPQELGAYVKEDTARWARVIKERNLKLE